MNTKTVLSRYPQFMEEWKSYKKQFPYVTEWYVASDYCLNKDSEKPTKVVTFTLCPAVNLEWLQTQINRFLKSDVKNHKNFSDTEIQFIRDNGFFFSIAVVVEKQGCGLVNKLKLELNSWISQIENEANGNVFAQRLKRFRQLKQYLDQKSYSTDLVTKITLVSFMVGIIIEFLIIKHNAQKVLWISDRGKVMDFSEGVSIELANMSYHKLVNGRRGQNFLFGVATEDPASKQFNFDPMIRYPDIISGVISSTDLYNNLSIGQKHFDMFVNGISGNRRIHVFRMLNGNLNEGYVFDKLQKTNKIIRASDIRKEQ